LEGTERLLRRWFDLTPAERGAMTVRARRSFVGRYTMNQTALAIERVFSLAAYPARKVDGISGGSKSDAGRNDLRASEVQEVTELPKA
jgi:hypothetical protein